MRCFFHGVSASRILLAVAIALYSCAAPLVAAPESAVVAHLPGFDGALPSKHYAGYVTVDESHGKNLFYYFVESEGNPTKDPVVLWLNGGPGSSSFDGFVYEHGPFIFESGGSEMSLPKLRLNPYSWSKVSSMIYLDSPAGVGLSYSMNASDYETSDLETAADAFTFLLKWFELYPEFLANPFYISGESHAGIYVPALSLDVVKGIQDGAKPTLNFKGYIIGNGECDAGIIDGNAALPFVHGMGLISDELYQEANSACHENYWNPNTERCKVAAEEVYQITRSLNRYNILEPCYSIASTKSRDVVIKNSRLPMGFTPCVSDEVATAWLNNKDVRLAIHAQPVSMIGSWLLSVYLPNFRYDAGSMLKYHKNLTTQGYRALLYSGDHDMAVPFTVTEACIRLLGYAIVDSWRPWIFHDQVAGYTQGYDHGLTFATIKGAGHMVPQYKPQEALALYSRWLAGNEL